MENIDQLTPRVYVGEHFIEAISEVEPDSIVEGKDPDRTEDSNQLLQDIRFKTTITGWSHRDQQHRDTVLLSLQNEPMAKRMQEIRGVGSGSRDVDA